MTRKYSDAATQVMRVLKAVSALLYRSVEVHARLAATIVMTCMDTTILVLQE